MLKRILIIIFVLNLGTACSRVSKKEEIELEKSKFYNSYNRWELDDLANELEEHKRVYGYTPEVIKFRFLLNERTEAKES